MRKTKTKTKTETGHDDVDDQSLSTNPSANRGGRLVAGLLLMAAAAVGLAAGEATPPTPAPAPTTPAVEAGPTSVPTPAVAEAIGKWRKRAEFSKTQGLDEAAKKDLAARLVKVDDLADGPADWLAITAAAVDYGLAPAGSTYAAALAALRAGEAAPAVVAAPAPAPVAAKPAAPVAEKPAEPTKTFQPGARAKLYALGAGTVWPPPALAPDLAPLSTLRIPGIPDAKPSWAQRPGFPGLVPNGLIDHAALDGQAFRAVEIVGHYFAKADGPVAIVVESNFPCTVEIGDRQVASTSWSAPITHWVRRNGGTQYTPNIITCADGKVVATATGATVPLVAKKYYPVRVVYFQSWRATAKNDVAQPWANSDLVADDTAGRALEVQALGARLKIRCTPPDAATPEPLGLYTLEIKKAPKDE